MKIPGRDHFPEEKMTVHAGRKDTLAFSFVSNSQKEGETGEKNGEKKKKKTRKRCTERDRTDQKVLKRGEGKKGKEMALGSTKAQKICVLSSNHRIIISFRGGGGKRGKKSFRKKGKARWEEGKACTCQLGSRTPAGL